MNPAMYLIQITLNEGFNFGGTMKKILIYSMILTFIFPTYCFAQTPKISFSIDGTLWEGIALYPFPEAGQSVVVLGFYNGKVFIEGPTAMVELTESFYTDSQVLSFFKASIAQGDVPPFIWRCWPTTLFGIIQPAVKSGTFIARIHFLLYITQTVIVFLHETDDNWMPEQF